MSKRNSKRSRKICNQPSHAQSPSGRIARALRARLRANGSVPPHVLSCVSNKDILWGYLTCCECREPLVASPLPLVERVRTAEGFLAAADALLKLHQVERHNLRAYDGDPRVGGAALDAAALRSRLNRILGDDIALGRADHAEECGEQMTVWDHAFDWAQRNFPLLDGAAYSFEELRAACEQGVREYPGIETKRWLFVYSPESANPFFEVSDDASSMMLAFAKLGTAASNGGMLLGVDFSENWATPRSVGRFTPLMVCKPGGNNGSAPDSGRSSSKT